MPEYQMQKTKKSRRSLVQIIMLENTPLLTKETVCNVQLNRYAMRSEVKFMGSSQIVGHVISCFGRGQMTD